MMNYGHFNDMLRHKNTLRAVIEDMQERMDTIKDFEEWQTAGRQMAALLDQMRGYEESLDIMERIGNERAAMREYEIVEGNGETIWEQWTIWRKNGEHRDFIGYADTRHEALRRIKADLGMIGKEEQR